MQTLQNNLEQLSHSTGVINGSKHISHCNVGETVFMFDTNFPLDISLLLNINLVSSEAI
jgi:hypothetical protein